MRTKSVKAIYDMTFKTFKLDGIWGRALGEPERNGCWMIWGKEKNGKTTAALMLADYLAGIENTLYISGEEGIGANFKTALKRAGVSAKTKLRINAYIGIGELDELLSKKRSPKIVFIDNITIYHEDLKYGVFRKLMDDHPDVLFVWLVHEEKKEPYTSTGKLCSKLAKVIMHVEGLAVFVSGRCNGGVVTIDENKATLYWGEAIKTNNNQ